MFLVGLIVGAVIGCFLGIFTIAIVSAGKIDDDHEQ